MKLQNLTHILIGILCIGLLPRAQAVVPPPDGGYPGFNTAEGQNALFSLTTGQFNTAVGALSLGITTDGFSNTAVGAGALLLATGPIAYENTAVGAFALLNNNGRDNTAVGIDALRSNTDGGVNTAVGYFALNHNTTGNFNCAIGGTAGTSVTTASNVIAINHPGANVDNSCYIGNIYGASIDPTNSLVGVDLNGKLGVTVSARRFKRDIQLMENASEAILALKPVTFHYKSDLKSIPCFGLVAEDVEKVNPDLVVRDKNGELLSVRYEQINAMLLNEFLKAHRTVQEQKATIAQLKSTDVKQEATIAKQQKQIEALTAGLQKVSDQLELSKAEPEVAVNNP